MIQKLIRSLRNHSFHKLRRGSMRLIASYSVAASIASLSGVLTAAEPLNSYHRNGSHQQSLNVHPSSRDGMWGTSAVHYEVLSRQAGRREDPKPRTWAPEVIRPVKPYAYGYFGASGSKSWYRQFGHQHSHVNYSLR